ncbi:peptidase C15 pyroglutamyl peptidase I [Thermoanaerobacter ethanolicus JW 200]|nr:peptidase C15 pyroglutamyl peptidase I [Thermoanaerobacter ethanolicus JW 200]
MCNHLMYGILNYVHNNRLNIKAGFIHIPYLPVQVLNKPYTPSMSLGDMVKAIETAIKVIAKKVDSSYLEEIKNYLYMGRDYYFL